MSERVEPQRPASTSRLVAAVDVGASALRMAVAQVLADGRIEVLELLQRSVRLGQDTFTRGRLSDQTIRASVAVLRDYQRVIDFYGVERVRAVATSAVREATNADTFLDRVLMATGLDVEVIVPTEESRLIVSSVRQASGKALGGAGATTLVVDVGGGSTLLTLLKRGEIELSQSLQLGSTRLHETLGLAHETPSRAAELLRTEIGRVLAAVSAGLPFKTVTRFMALGRDAQFAARRSGVTTRSEDLTAVPRPGFDRVVESVEGQAADELARAHGLPFGEAETLMAALLVYQGLLHATRARQVLVSQVSMRDGLVLELARSVTGGEDESLAKGILHSAEALAERFRADLPHARQVAELSARLFDELEPEHRLTPRQRLLLRVAALVHDVGLFVSGRSHHKHSYYLIANSEIFGLARDELTLVALVARYHRQSCPKPTHAEYMALPRATRVAVSKLAALLRVADALDTSHAQQVETLTCERSGDELVVRVTGTQDLTLERRSLAGKGDLLEEVYGLRVRLEEAAP